MFAHLIYAFPYWIHVSQVAQLGFAKQLAEALTSRSVFQALQSDRELIEQFHCIRHGRKVIDRLHADKQCNHGFTPSRGKHLPCLGTAYHPPTHPRRHA